MRDHLVHGSDTTSTTDGETVGKLVGLVSVFGDRTLEGQGLSGLEVSDVLRHFTVLRKRVVVSFGSCSVIWYLSHTS